MRTRLGRLGSVALVLCTPLCAYAEPGGSALSFSAARIGMDLFEPRVEIARLDLDLREGDALEYDLMMPAPCAQRAGVEVVLADGRRSEAPVCTPDSAWHRVRVPLDALRGGKVARVELVARGSLAAEIGFRVDDIVIVHAAGEPTVVFRDALDAGALVRDDQRCAGAATIGSDAGWSGVRARLSDAPQSEPWSAYDLTNLRRAFESEGRDAAGPRDDLLTGPCVPLRFARAGQSAFVRATGQRLSFQPVEGGRAYTIWIAASLDEGGPLATHAFVFGDEGERRAVDFDVPANDAGDADALDLGGCFLIELPVASVVPLQGIQLPDEPRLRIHAITFQWRRDGPTDPRFRLAWLRHASDHDRDLDVEQRAGIGRYVRNRAFGPLFVAPAADEMNGERAIFEALLVRDHKKLASALRAGLAAQERTGAPLKPLRIALEDVHGGRGTLSSDTPRGAPIGADELMRAVRALPKGVAAVIDGDLARMRQVPQLLRASGIEDVIVPGGVPIARWTGPDGSSVQLAGAFDRIEEMRQFGDLPWREWIGRASSGATSPELFVPVGGTDASRADAAALADLLASVDEAPRVRMAGPEAFMTQAVKRLGAALPQFSPGDLRPISDGDAAGVAEAIVSSRRASAAIGALRTFGTLARADGAPSIDALVESSRQDVSAETEPARTARIEQALIAQLDVLARGATTTGAGTPIVAFNALPWTRHALITLEASNAGLVGADGKDLPSQPAAGGGRVFALDVPALGYEVLHGLRAVESTAPAASATEPAHVAVEGWSARNDAVAFVVDPQSGAITSLKTLPDGEEMLAEPARLSGDGWVVQSADFVERGPLRAVARIVSASPTARATIDFVLAARARTLEVRCSLASDSHSALPTFDLALAHGGARALSSVPFGSSPAGPADGRPARHALCDWMLSIDGTHGVAVLAMECATVLVSPNRLAVEMLAPASADKARTTSFALAPFAQGWKKAGLPQRAHELAAPVELITTTAHDGARGPRHACISIARAAFAGPLVSGPDSGVMLSSLETASDGSWLLRLVETEGIAQDVVIELDRPVFDAQRVDSSGAVLGALRHDQGRVRLAVGPNRIENVLVRLRP